ncbi:MAG: inositol monophosphatase family protein [bacterium]
MQDEYQKIIDYMLSSGKRIKEKAGQIADIGIKKKYLTEEDIAIERGFSDLIGTFQGDHIVFAEEENFDFQEGENIWVIDPISSTPSFIGGLPHYAIVCSHLFRGEVFFAAVYDPSVDELFTAYKGKGAFLNEKKLDLKYSESNGIILSLSTECKDQKLIENVWSKSLEFKPYRYKSSFGINYCWVAAGRFNGFIALVKDNFPTYAGKLMIEEAGGVFTNERRESNIKESDRIFVGGSKEIYDKLVDSVQRLIQ